MATCYSGTCKAFLQCAHYVLQRHGTDSCISSSVDSLHWCPGSVLVSFGV
jgi:hypothetical protein